MLLIEGHVYDPYFIRNDEVYLPPTLTDWLATKREDYQWALEIDAKIHSPENHNKYLSILRPAYFTNGGFKIEDYPRFVEYFKQRPISPEISEATTLQDFEEWVSLNR